MRSANSAVNTVIFAAPGLILFLHGIDVAGIERRAQCVALENPRHRFIRRAFGSSEKVSTHGLR